MYNIHWSHDGGRGRFFFATWSRATRRRLAMFVVLGASGNTGKVVAETLLRQKKKVRVVLHDAASAKAWGEAGAMLNHSRMRTNLLERQSARYLERFGFA